MKDIRRNNGKFGKLFCLPVPKQPSLCFLDGSVGHTRGTQPSRSSVYQSTLLKPQQAPSIPMTTSATSKLEAPLSFSRWCFNSERMRFKVSLGQGQTRTSNRVGTRYSLLSLLLAWHIVFVLLQLQQNPLLGLAVDYLPLFFSEQGNVKSTIRRVYEQG